MRVDQLEAVVVVGGVRRAFEQLHKYGDAVHLVILRIGVPCRGRQLGRPGHGRELTSRVDLKPPVQAV